MYKEIGIVVQHHQSLTAILLLGVAPLVAVPAGIRDVLSAHNAGILRLGARPLGVVGIPLEADIPLEQVAPPGAGTLAGIPPGVVLLPEEVAPHTGAVLHIDDAPPGVLPGAVPRGAAAAPRTVPDAVPRGAVPRSAPGAVPRGAVAAPRTVRGAAVAAPRVVPGAAPILPARAARVPPCGGTPRVRPPRERRVPHVPVPRERVLRAPVWALVGLSDPWEWVRVQVVWRPPQISF